MDLETLKKYLEYKDGKFFVKGVQYKDYAGVDLWVGVEVLFKLLVESTATDWDDKLLAAALAALKKPI